MAKQRIITLLTDFGPSDGYVGAMKGVLLSLAGEATLVDITHEIPPGNVLAGAFVLNQVLGYFPPGTVHLAVVDPGVGTDRRILAAQYSGQLIVAPDNGLISMVALDHQLEAIASVRNEQFFLPNRVGATFDGRDVMAPVAAALARGERLERLGPPPSTYNLLEVPLARFDGKAVIGQVLYVDHFGNCVTNIRRKKVVDALTHLAAVTVWADGKPVGPLRTAFAHVGRGEPAAIFGSMDLLEVAVNGGRACDALGLAVGSPVVVRYADGA
jgi:S-adenosyl-L-methionine hydrolase (adenosine-forming)